MISDIYPLDISRMKQRKGNLTLGENTFLYEMPDKYIATYGKIYACEKQFIWIPDSYPINLKGIGFFNGKYFLKNFKVQYRFTNHCGGAIDDFITMISIDWCISDASLRNKVSIHKRYTSLKSALEKEYKKSDDYIWQNRFEKIWKPKQ